MSQKAAELQKAELSLGEKSRTIDEALANGKIAAAEREMGFKQREAQLDIQERDAASQLKGREAELKSQGKGIGLALKELALSKRDLAVTARELQLKQADPAASEDS